MKRKKVKFKTEIVLSFFPYDSKKKNERARSSLRRTIRNALRNSDFYAMYIEKDEGGSQIEDVAQVVSVKFR